MRRKFTILTTVGLCLVLAFGVALAAERGRDTTVDRAKRGSVATGAAADGGDSVEFSGQMNTMFSETVYRSRVENATGANKARALLTHAFTQDDGDALVTLQQILGMDLPETPETEKILAGVYTTLAGLYEEAPAKQVHNLGMALRYTSDPTRRARLESRIDSLGGNAVAFAFNGSNNTAPRTIGANDTCDDPAATATMTAIGDLVVYSGLTIDPGVADADWYWIDVVSGDPGLGFILRIETISYNPPFVDDTDLTLWGICDAGVPDQFLAFNDDGGDGFMSRIDTGCMGPGTYYLEVGGFADVAGADNFDLEIEAYDDCVVPQPDGYEPDNTRADATPIGHEKPNTKPEAAAQDIQAHNIFPPGDIDLVSFTLKETSWINMETRCAFPTIFNDYNPEPCSNGDTVIFLLYNEQTTYGGLCNQQTAPGSFSIIGPPCLTDDDCPDPLQYPIPGFPPCLPWSLFSNPSADPVDNALAFNDDGGEGLSSKLELCLPRTNKKSPSSTVELQQPDFNWYLQIQPFSSSATFDYEVAVQNIEKCHFECENNDDFPVGKGTKCKKKNENNHITLGEAIHGIYDFRVTIPDPDPDLFDFDVEEETRITFETLGYNINAVDTYIEIFVGPDENGDYFLTGLADEDGGAGFLSLLDVILPPSCELLGTPCPGSSGKGVTHNKEGSSYWMLVTSMYYNTNFPYTLTSEVKPVPIIEDVDFSDCGDGGEQVVELGSEVVAAIDPVCDFDGYKLSLTANADVTWATLGGGDTTIQLVDCDTNEVYACDDDGGPGLASLISGCLPGGRNYCLRVRAYSSFATFGYGLTVTGTEDCVATDPPTLVADDGLGCTDYDDC